SSPVEDAPGIQETRSVRLRVAVVGAELLQAITSTRAGPGKDEIAEEAPLGHVGRECTTKALLPQHRVSRPLGGFPVLIPPRPQGGTSAPPPTSCSGLPPRRRAPTADSR